MLELGLILIALSVFALSWELGQWLGNVAGRIAEARKARSAAERYRLAMARLCEWERGKSRW